MDADDRMPGDAEAAGAAAQMIDLYGRTLTKGSEVRFRRDGWPAGRTDEGHVVAFGRGRVLVETSDDVVEVEPDEILPF